MSPRDEAERFWAKVDKGLEPDSCWIWTGATNELGYGSFGIEGHRTELAHRTAWRITFGKLPDEPVLRHRCDNPPCVRPNHLIPGTQVENVADQIARGRRHQTSGTLNGHAKLTPESVELIRASYIPGKVRIIDLAKEFGVSKSQIWNVISRREWNEFPAVAP